ncbi:hypothetical protein [Streptomyces prunicolor]
MSISSSTGAITGTPTTAGTVPAPAEAALTALAHSATVRLS